MAKAGKRGINPGGSLSTQEVATVLGVSHPTLLKLLKQKKIPEPQMHGKMRSWTSADVRHAQVVVRKLHEDGELRAKGRE
jgi:excisionase family DNA binding protein